MMMKTKKKTNRTKGCARLFCTQLETQSNRIEHIRCTRSSRKNKCQTKHAHTIYICVKLLLKYLKSTHTHTHSERTQTGIESRLRQAKKPPSVVLSLIYDEILQFKTSLHHFIWLLLISSLLPLCDGRMSFESDKKNHHRCHHNESRSSHTTENHYPSQNDLMIEFVLWHQIVFCLVFSHFMLKFIECQMKTLH